MKKLLLLIAVWSLFFVAPVAVMAAEEKFFSDDFITQKEFWINNKATCQAVRIHKNWFLTAAHCVEACRHKSCQLRILLAVGNVTASAVLSSSDVFIPEEYTEGKEAGTVLWDIALLHYRPATYDYISAETGVVDMATFSKAMKEDPDLKAQWQGAQRPQLRPLVVYSGPELMHLPENIVVPRWTRGDLSYFSHPKYILYAGQKQALWVSDGFGVDHGNSGGAVQLANSLGIVGVVSARKNNDLPADVRREFPAFGQNGEFFMFTGLSKKTTWPFVRDTMGRFGDSVKTEKLRPIPVQEP